MKKKQTINKQKQSGGRCLLTGCSDRDVHQSSTLTNGTQPLQLLLLPPFVCTHCCVFPNQSLVDKE